MGGASGRRQGPPERSLGAVELAARVLPWRGARLLHPQQTEPRRPGVGVLALPRAEVGRLAGWVAPLERRRSRGAPNAQFPAPAALHRTRRERLPCVGLITGRPLPPLVRPHHQVLHPEDAWTKVPQGGGVAGVRRPACAHGRVEVHPGHVAVLVAQGGTSVQLQLGPVPLLCPCPRARHRRHSCKGSGAHGGNGVSSTNGTVRWD